MSIPLHKASVELIAAPNALRDHDLSFRALADALPQMVWSALPDGFHDYYNARWYEFTGVAPGSTDGEGWSGVFHPDDQERAWAAWRHSLDTGTPYEIDYRLRHHSGDYCWTLGRGVPVRDDKGRIVRWIGTCTDIDETKRVAEHNAILSRELSHRIKNIFAVITGLVSLSSRQQAGHEEFAGSLKHRIAALGRAHEFVRPHSEQSRPSMLPDSLHGIIRQILAPYPALDEGKISVAGDDVPVDDRSATPIALVIHELATNAAKYGALSAADGRVTISTRLKDDQVTIEWRETGGPIIDGEPGRSGFGSELIDLSVVRQLGGQFDRSWDKGGLVATIVIDRARVSR